VAKVEFLEVSKKYGDAGAVSNVNLTIEDHEFVVLLGPSGCGKSTLLKMVAGLEEITEGEIYIGEQMVNYTHPAKRNVAMVFQNYALYPHMTVADNIGFPLKMTGVSKDETKRRVASAANVLGLDPYLDRRPEQLSGGQRQRVALGRALVREPAVFLMDEPLSNLDAQLRVQTREEIMRLHARLQTTTIYVTHDQIEAMTMGQRIVVMRAGEVQQVGAPQEVYDHPVNTFVAAFLGSPRINLHAGSIERAGDAASFRVGETLIPLPAKLAANLTGEEDGDVALAVRPEDISVQFDPATNNPHAAVLPATVALIEPVGSDLYVNAAGSDALTWMARTDPRLPVTRGQPVHLALDLAQAHLFGPDGRNLAIKP
jgi:multiple sugar transport system ATP-binding protein